MRRMNGKRPVRDKGAPLIGSEYNNAAHSAAETESAYTPVPPQDMMEDDKKRNRPRAGTDYNDCKTPYFSGTEGFPVSDDANLLTVGEDGPALLADTYFVEKIAHFARERIPERVVHAKGAGAHGVFRCYASFEKFTKAYFLQYGGTETPVFVRFSTVIGGRGSPDTVRDPRGFAVKFYTREGNYDIVGNHLPVFFIRDAIKFPDVIHSLKPSPDSNLTDTGRFWDFISLTPEATHMITWLYSDRGTIKSYRHVDGFGVNTYVWVCPEGKRRLIKYHWKTLQGLETINRAEAIRLAGIDPDIAVRDLHDAIERGDYPQFELCVQMMDPGIAGSLPFDPLDDTKTWDENRFPLIKVGVMTLNRNPDNFFAETEQAAFCPANLVPGIEFSDDKMLVGRGFSYRDAHRYRIGTNFAQLPINRPLMRGNNYTQDGQMAFEYNPGKVNYYPNSLAEGNPPLFLEGITVPRAVSGVVDRSPICRTDDFTQAGERFLSMSPQERTALCSNIAVELKHVRRDIAQRVLGYFAAANPAFAEGVRREMSI